MEKLVLPNFGKCVVEDFVPYTNERALITAGPGFRELKFVLDVSYRFGEDLKFYDPQILRKGQYVRLGHYAGTSLVYSDGWQGPHQPFRHNGKLYHSDDAPHARLYCDGKVLIDHWPGVAEVCNPWVDEFIFFEARDEDVEAPLGWNIYRADLDGRNIVKLFPGANPCLFGDKLYYGLWNGQCFDIATADRRDCLSADAHLPIGRPDPERRSREAGAGHRSAVS